MKTDKISRQNQKKQNNQANESESQESNRAKPEDADIIIQHDDKELQKAQNKETK